MHKQNVCPSLTLVITRTVQSTNNAQSFSPRVQALCRDARGSRAAPRAARAAGRVAAPRASRSAPQPQTPQSGVCVSRECVPTCFLRKE